MLNLINFRLLGSMSKNFVDLSEVHYPRFEELEFGLINLQAGPLIQVLWIYYQLWSPMRDNYMDPNKKFLQVSFNYT